MPTWLSILIPNQWWLLFIGVIAIGGGLFWFHHSAYESGKTQEANIQLAAQIKHSTKVRKDYAKIDHATPSTGNNATLLNWLSKYTTGDQ